MKKWFYALALPIFVQVAGFIWLNYEGNLIETVIGFAMTAILFSLFWGLVVLIPVSITQILCARSLTKANCRDYERFLIGLLNPGIAISLLILSGVIAQNISR